MKLRETQGNFIYFHPGGIKPEVGENDRGPREREGSDNKNDNTNIGISDKYHIDVIVGKNLGGVAGEQKKKKTREKTQ